MSSEDFFVLLSVVFKKFGLVFNEFLPVVDCLFHVGIINFSLEFYIAHFGNDFLAKEMQKAPPEPSLFD